MRHDQMKVARILKEELLHFQQESNHSSIDIISQVETIIVMWIIHRTRCS